MNKERLEEIRNSYLEGFHRLFDTPWISMPKENFDWLIKQAELAEQSEEENDELAERVHKLALDWSELVDERNRYKQALEEISNADWNSEGLDAERELDRVTDIAFKALEGEE